MRAGYDAAFDKPDKHSENMNPLHSMTGFSSEVLETPAGRIHLELRAVNSRFLDLVFKLGEEFRTLEPALRERITEKVKRGKLECRLQLVADSTATLPEQLDTALLARLARLAGSARAALPDARPLSLGEILRWPGMLGAEAPDPEALAQATLRLLDRALDEFNASRGREGDKLRATLRERTHAARERVGKLRPRVPAIVAAYRDKLQRRMEELLSSPDHDRLHQEVALFAQKIDVDEELDRLLTHLDEVDRVLAAGGASGKRLDFLMQELHREANTLGSKAAVVELSQASIELKVLIEQMREQVQNLE